MFSHRFLDLLNRWGFTVSLSLWRFVKSVQTTHCEIFPCLSKLSQDTARSHIKRENKVLENTVSFLQGSRHCRRSSCFGVFVHQITQNILAVHLHLECNCIANLYSLQNNICLVQSKAMSRARRLHKFFLQQNNISKTKKS